MSLQEVVRTVHMKLDLARLQRRVVDVLVTNLAKFFDVIACYVHPIVGARPGLGDESPLATHIEGVSYTLPLGPWQSDSLAQLLDTPQGTIKGVHAGATATLPFLSFMDIADRAFAVMPFRFPGLMWVDDTVVISERGDTRPIHGFCWTSGRTTRVLRVDVPDRKVQYGSTTDPQPLHSPTSEAVAGHVGPHVGDGQPGGTGGGAGAPELPPS